MRQLYDEKMEKFLKEYIPKMKKKFNVNIGDTHKIEDIIANAIIDYNKLK